MDKEDKKFFMVKVPTGRETQTIFLIKYRTELLNLPIYSAIFSQDLSGLIFVEADDYETVMRAVKNLRSVVVFEEPLSANKLIGKNKDEGEMDILSSFKIKYPEKKELEEKHLEPGIIVEIIDGPFKGRKARIVSISKKRVWVDLMHGGGALLVEVNIDHIRPTE
ncbi:MAG: KOW motif-containing protein [Candidatus Njordarchaeales archaeon]